MTKETKFQILFKCCSQNRSFLIYFVSAAEILALWQTLRKFSFSSAVTLVLTHSFHSSISLTQQSKALFSLSSTIFPSTFQVCKVPAIRHWTKTVWGWYRCKRKSEGGKALEEMVILSLPLPPSQFPNVIFLSHYIPPSNMPPVQCFAP